MLVNREEMELQLDTGASVIIRPIETRLREWRQYRSERRGNGLNHRQQERSIFSYKIRGGRQEICLQY